MLLFQFLLLSQHVSCCVFQVAVWCGAEGYVSGLQDVALLYNTLALLMMGIVVPETC